MPKRTDIKSILLIGSGPIVIGQACEFDYSGTQAVKALREEGYRVALVNSNPATIMTDPDLADRTYVEPLTPEVLERVIAAERPDAVLPTLGGQTALNLAVELAQRGVLARHGVELIGASIEAIEKAEKRDLFKVAMKRIGLDVPRSDMVHSLTEAWAAQRAIGFPAIIRPSFTLGGSGANIAYGPDQFGPMVEWGLQQSPRHEVLIEESVLGWKEYELEVMRDGKDNVVIVCSIENLDPMGVHTGDSITVAPALTLTDKEYQRMRDAAAAVIREIGVATGGSNIQFAVAPDGPNAGRMVVIEMNPRVSRSSALASKATGFPIAKIAAKLAVGYTLDEIQNDITRETPACFEPTIDYVVVKVPRFSFEKFPGADPTLALQMKSVGEAMAIGRTFREALGKAMRALETGRYGFDFPVSDAGRAALLLQLAKPHPDRLWLVAEALRRGVTLDELASASRIDPWFIEQIAAVVAVEEGLRGSGWPDAERLREAKRSGLSDRRIAQLCGKTEEDVLAARRQTGVKPSYKRVDTCAAEFDANTPYLYSTYDEECEARPNARPKVIILGGGPNRIGQGIEFDYCCVHAALALKQDGFETVMVNCNPETVSTDYDISDRLYFEPLTREDVLAIVDKERSQGAEVGLIVQFGGQTPLRLAVGLAAAGVKILGTSADAIDRAEDRERFGALLDKLSLRAPRWGAARTTTDALRIARSIGYPVMVRPSYVLGGRAMEVVVDDAGIESYMSRALDASPDHPVLIDGFLRDATEIDIDVLCDGHDVVIGGVMEHIEEAGIHSGDSACALPPHSLDLGVVAEIKAQASALARELGVVGLMNAQFAVPTATREVYVLEVNPRASRTVPFVSKATGLPLAKIAARIMAGKTLRELGVREITPAHVAVKESVFPFVKFPGVDPILGPEMRSTGEVMGIDHDFAAAFAKSQQAAGNALPTGGVVFLSVRAADKPGLPAVAKRLVEQGFALEATGGTADILAASGLPVTRINKIVQGPPHCVDAILEGRYAMVVNTTEGRQSILDSAPLRRAAVHRGIPYFTTLAAARAAAAGIAVIRGQSLGVRPLQDYYGKRTTQESA